MVWVYDRGQTRQGLYLLILVGKKCITCMRKKYLLFFLQVQVYHLYAKKISFFLQVQVPLWSRMGILDGFSETKELLPITGDKTTKNKVMMVMMMRRRMIMMMITGYKTTKNKVIVPNHQITKNPCHKSPNQEVLLIQHIC